MKTKGHRKIAAILICAAMLLAMLPAAVFAEGEGSSVPPAGTGTESSAPAGGEGSGSGTESSGTGAGSESSGTGTETSGTGAGSESSGSGTETSGTGTGSESSGTGAGSSEAGTGAESSGTGTGTGTGSGTESSGTGSGTEETPGITNSDIVVIPSNANALVLMDVGAQSPKGVPGDVITVVLPIAVNKEYLPSENYILRNINIIPDIPTDSGVSNWPFDIIDAGSTRHLQDMSYNSTADVYFDFRISQFAKKGVYPVKFKVNATVWRYDDVNGTTVTEDVTFPLCVYATITDNGSMSGVTTAFGCLQVAGSNISGTYSVPVATPGQSVTLRIPVVNVGGTLTDITVNPVASSNLDTFPFVARASNYGKSFDSWASGEIKTLDFSFTVSDYATSGNKVISFKGTYFENGSAAESTFSTQLTIVGGYEPSSISVMVQSYKLFVSGTEVSGLTAGEEGDLILTIVNNSGSDRAGKVMANLVFANSPGLTIAPGSTDSAYIDGIAAGGSAAARFKIMAKPDAEAGSAVLGVGLTYESADSVTGTANQNIMIPVSQKMDLMLGTPAVYGKQIKGREASISLPITNMGRGKALNVRVLGADGITISSPCYVGDILAGASITADISAGFSKIGSYMGTLIVQYEDANGTLYTSTAQVQLNVSENSAASDPANNNNNNPGTGNQQGSSSGQGQSILPWILLAVVAVAAIIVIAVMASKNRKPGGGIGA